MSILLVNPNNMEIYKTTNLINGKIYIGKSVKGRPWYLGSGVYLTRTIKKEGRQNFKKEILEICYSQNELNVREIYWIKKFDSRNPLIGYNITIGGDGWTGNHHTEESKKKMSIAKKGRKFSDEVRKHMSENNARHMLGKHHTKEAKEKMAKARRGKKPWNKGMPHSTETKKKISERCSGFTGKHHTEEHKLYMSSIKKGVSRPPEVILKMKATKKKKKDAKNSIDKSPIP